MITLDVYSCAGNHFGCKSYTKVKLEERGTTATWDMDYFFTPPNALCLFEDYTISLLRIRNKF